MSVRSFQYYAKEGVKSITVNSFMTIASIATVAASLFILGAFLIFTMNVNNEIEQMAKDCELQIFIDESVNRDSAVKIGEQILQISGVESIQLLTREQILQDFTEKLKDDAEALEGLSDDNPFRDSYKIKVTDLSLTSQVAKEVLSFEGVAKITDFYQTFDVIVRVRDAIKNISIWFILFLSLISAFIISNTVKVAVFARRKEINIMKYIGATDWFIRWPFVIEGVIIGILGALVSFLAVFFGYNQVLSKMNIGNITLLSGKEVLYPVLGVLILCGVLIGSLGSVISIRKHLKV